MPARTNPHPATVVTVSRRLFEAPLPPGVSFNGDGPPTREHAPTALVLHLLATTTTASSTRATWSRRELDDARIALSSRVVRARVNSRDPSPRGQA